MSPGLLLFTGAPDANTLSWEPSGLINNFSEPFFRFARLYERRSIASEPSLSEEPAWRSIPLARQHLATGHSQNHDWQNEYQDTEFFTADSFVENMSQPSTEESQRSIAPLTDQVLSQFYEQSYAVHEDISSSQLATASGLSSSVYSETSFGATDSLYGSQSHSMLRKQDIPDAGHLSNLKDIPNAAYLNSIEPQTMTVNLIVGIISLPPPRAIKTRRGADVELIEVLVGDETKSGFGVNFWLSASQSDMTGDLRKVLSSLRPQDVVLLRNVALNSFRGKVYGQSLRKSMTKVHLLYRSRIDKSDVRGCYSAADLSPGENLQPQIEKTRSVREWVLRFVGVGARRQSKRQIEAIKETLPPDTQ